MLRWVARWRFGELWSMCRCLRLAVGSLRSSFFCVPVRPPQLEREQRTEQQVQSLQAEIANLQSFIHRPLTLGSAPNEPAQRRRHTLGATPAKSRGALRRSGEARSSAAAAALADDSGAFRAEQLACAQGKIAEFETLLSELSAENAELTQIRDDVLARCETVSGTSGGGGVRWGVERDARRGGACDATWRRDV